MQNYKGIILAGGTGSRLYPLNQAFTKHLLPIYDKPMIYYPLSVLMLAGIREIQIICAQNDIDAYNRLLGDGSRFGISLSYAIQEKPDGIGQAFIISENFIGRDNVCLILGDNIFYGQGLTDALKRGSTKSHGATVFGYPVNDPARFGVISFDRQHNVLSIEEKPTAPKSNYAVTGLYSYDNNVISYAKDLKPSKRGELEITDINRCYLGAGALSLELLGRGTAWFDGGTNQSISDASNFIETIQSRQGLKIACLEEIALMKNWITSEDLRSNIHISNKNDYSRYLMKLLETNYD